MNGSGLIMLRQGCIMSPWLFSVYMDAVMKEVKMEWEGGEKAEIAWPLVYRQLGSIWRVRGRAEGNGGMFF